MTTPGTILYLNGSPSSGKSSIARALQARLPAPYLHVGIDTLFAAASPRFQRIGTAEELAGTPDDIDRAVLGPDGRLQEIHWGVPKRTMSRGLHAMVAALAREGNHVIADDVVFEPWMARHCAQAMQGLPAHLIAVRCDVEEAERRELERGDRMLGLARYFSDVVDRFPAYDLEVDTSILSTEAASDAILAYLDEGRPPSAFGRLL